MGLSVEQRRLLFCNDRDAPLDALTASATIAGDIYIERFSFASTHAERVTAVLYRPAAYAEPAPVVLIGHGAASSKDDALLRPLFEHWAGEGLACVCVDAPHHGERAVAGVSLWSLLGRPFAGLHFGVQTVVDTMRAVDWIRTRADLNAGRIGYVGFSMGTVLGVQFVAMEPAVRAAVFALGGAGLLHYLAAQAPADQRADHELVADALDPVHYAPLIAPRPVLTVNGTRDDVIPAALGHALYGCLREPKRAIWYDGGHGDIPHGQILEMGAFLQEHLDSARRCDRAPRSDDAA